MFDFGEELIIDNYRIPWIIWIQLVVMFLLIFIFYFFSFDHSSTAAADGDASSSSPSTALYSAAENNQPSENQIVKEPGSHASRETERREDIHESEGCSGKDETNVSHFGRPHHPCHFLGIAKQAFLKCLGLDFSSESSSNSDQRKEQ